MQFNTFFSNFLLGMYIKMNIFIHATYIHSIYTMYLKKTTLVVRVGWSWDSDEDGVEMGE